LPPALRGYRLGGDRYEAIEPDVNGWLRGKELGPRMCLEGWMLRFRDMRNGRRVLTRHVKADQERRRAQREARKGREAAKKAEQERQRAEPLLAELDRPRASSNPCGISEPEK
jgi:hypothetical protein